MKIAKRFVFDTNILVSTFLLSETSKAALAYYKARSSGELIVSKDTFNEFSEVFLRPKFDRYVSLNKRLSIIEDLKHITRIVNPTRRISACRDPKDNMYLELAVETGASCIISGDRDLLILNPFETVPIVTPSEFIDIQFD